MPFARWIKNMNGRLVLLWNDEIKMSTAARAKPFGQVGNLITDNAKLAQFSAGKIEAL